MNNNNNKSKSKSKSKNKSKSKKRSKSKNNENDNDNEDKKVAKQGDTRDLLGKEDTEKALLKKAIPGEIEDIPVSSLEREIDENDSIASDRGITHDALVDSPFSDLDYKKVTGKRSRHFVS